MKIAIIPGQPILLPYFGDGFALAERLEVEGTDSISLCILTFFNGDEQNTTQQKKVNFQKADNNSRILTPERKFKASDYLFCSLKIFAGNAYDAAGFYLHLKVVGG